MIACVSDVRVLLALVLAVGISASPLASSGKIKEKNFSIDSGETLRALISVANAEVGTHYAEADRRLMVLVFLFSKQNGSKIM